jgi:uncharacterized protein (TIGR02646 family)
MIMVVRSRCPTILTSNSSSWTTDLCKARRAYYDNLASYETHLSNTKPKKAEAVSARYAHPEVLDELVRIFNGKCAYCESHIAHVTYKAIDHFRPQSIFPTLAYSWENLLLCCPKCNSDYKKAKFPLQDGEMAKPDRMNPCSLGTDLLSPLINPCESNPDDHFDFTMDTPIAKTYNGAKTISVTRIDREELNDRRRAHLLKFRALVKIYIEADKDQRLRIKTNADEMIRSYIDSTSEYLAFTRAVLRQNNLLSTFPC